MRLSYIFILLTVINLFFVSCGEDREEVPLKALINFNGFLDSFRGGKIEVNIYGNTENSCSDFLEGADIKDKPEKVVTIDIPDEGDIELSKEAVSIQPGEKTVYAVLKDKNNDKKGHDCRRIIKCLYVGFDPMPEEAYDIKAGDKACVFIDLKLIP